MLGALVCICHWVLVVLSKFNPCTNVRFGSHENELLRFPPPTALSQGSHLFYVGNITNERKKERIWPIQVTFKKSKLTAKCKPMSNSKTPFK